MSQIGLRCRVVEGSRRLFSSGGLCNFRYAWRCFLDSLIGTAVKLIDEIRQGWQGTSRPSALFGVTFAASCLALSTMARWGLSLIRPDVYFTPYFPAVFFATAFGGYRIGIATAVMGGVFGIVLNFGDAPTDFARLALLAIYAIVSSLTIWGVEHYRSLATRQREISKRLMQEQAYRKLLVNELRHRLKN